MLILAAKGSPFLKKCCERVPNVELKVLVHGA